jgi:hypothetical protein
MASATWTIGNSSGNWTTGADWSTGTVPAAGDSVFLTRTNIGNYVVSLNAIEPAGGGSYAALTVGNSQATISLGVVGNTLSVSGNTGLSIGTINISSTSTLATGSFTATGGTFVESAGKLSVTGLASFSGAGSDTISGGTFNAGTLTVGDGTTAQTLTLSGGTTTVSGLATINNASSSGGSKIVMGSTASVGALVATGGISFGGSSSRGTLSGKGAVTGGTISGAGTITATGGTLDIGNAIGSGPILTIGTASVSDMKLDGTATSAAAIAINNANQTLEIGTVGALTIGQAETVSLGTIRMSGGTLTDSSGLILGSGGNAGSLTGQGIVAASLDKGGSSAGNTITAKGGTLDLTGTVGSGLAAAIDSNSASDLKFDNSGTLAAALSITTGNRQFGRADDRCSPEHRPRHHQARWRHTHRCRRHFVRRNRCGERHAERLRHRRGGSDADQHRCCRYRHRFRRHT